MIVLEDKEVVIITPPRTGSLMLHELLCKRRHSYWIESTDKNRHTITIPNEFKRFRQMLLVRNPYPRLLGLRDELNEHLAIRQKRPLSLPEYIDRRHQFRMRHASLMTTWVDGIEACAVLHLETLKQDLADHLEINVRVPRLEADNDRDWLKVFKKVDYERLAVLYTELVPDLVYGYYHSAITPVKASAWSPCL